MRKTYMGCATAMHRRSDERVRTIPTTALMEAQHESCRHSVELGSQAGRKLPFFDIGQVWAGFSTRVRPRHIAGGLRPPYTTAPGDAHHPSPRRDWWTATRCRAAAKGGAVEKTRTSTGCPASTSS